MTRVEVPIFDPEIPIPVFAPPLGGLAERAEFGQFSPKQREWLLRRDEYRCQWPDGCPNHVGNVGSRNLHAHHILAAAYYRENYNHNLSDDPHEQTESFPENGIILCRAHHTGKAGIHPDYYKALENYRKGDKGAFQKVGQKHYEMAGAGEIYWDTTLQVQLDRIAAQRTEDYLSAHPEDPFPYDD